VALDIRPAAASSPGKTNPTGAASKAGTDLFSIQLATTRPAPPAKSRLPSKSEANSKTDAGDESPARSESSASTTAGGAENQPASSDATSNSATAGDANSARDIARTTEVTKGGRSAARSDAAQAVASQASDTRISKDVIADPTAQNASGPSLVQLLARSLKGNEAAAPPADIAAPPSADSGAAAPAETQQSTVATSDPNASALSVFTQSLAAALGASTGTTSASSAAPQGAAFDASPEAAQAVTQSAGNVRSASRGSAQELVSLLTQDVAADAQSKSDAVALRSDVAVAKSSADDTSAANITTANAGPVAQPLPHLGIASHFSPTDIPGGELKSPVGSAAWNDELGATLTWMTHQGLESGSLRVAPEHLGPVEVQITVQNGDASVWFGASHPDTRAALEQALPRLREMFASQGLTLTDSGVSRESLRDYARPAAPQGVSAAAAIGSSDVSVSAAVRASLGLIDTYA